MGAATLYSPRRDRDPGRSSDANLFVGHLAGIANTTGNANTLRRAQRRASNLGGNVNTFVERAAGALNSSGFANTFSGPRRRISNTTAARARSLA